MTQDAQSGTPANVPDASQATLPSKAWLVSEQGAWYLLSADTTRIGRAPDNDLVIHGPDSMTVSLHHLVIQRSSIDSRFEFVARDLESTNGTFLNGVRIAECLIRPGDSIRLGSQLVLSLSFQEPPALEFDQTISSASQPVNSVDAAPRRPNSTYENLLIECVKRVRLARIQGTAGHTATIIRETVDRALHRASRRSRIVIRALAVGLVCVIAIAGWRITELNRDKQAIDRQIAELEARLQQTDSTDEENRLITQLNGYEAQGIKVEHDPLYRVGHRSEDPVTDEIRTLMAEFGAEVYSVPPEFTARVSFYIKKYQGPDRPLMTRALGSDAGQITYIRNVVEEQHLPADLSYMPVVESALSEPSRSSSDAVGLWQLTPATARAYGLRVDAQLDERHDTVKSTRAACRYLRDLILDFGSGSSVLLALAAYDSGPSKVKQAIRRVVADPIKQRNFWYLYRTRALPLETREYVPKVVAAMSIARDPHRFAF